MDDPGKIPALHVKSSTRVYSNTNLRLFFDTLLKLSQSFSTKGNKKELLNVFFSSLFQKHLFSSLETIFICLK